MSDPMPSAFKPLPLSIAALLLAAAFAVSPWHRPALASDPETQAAEVAQSDEAPTTSGAASDEQAGLREQLAETTAELDGSKKALASAEEEIHDLQRELEETQSQLQTLRDLQEEEAEALSEADEQIGAAEEALAGAQAAQERMRQQHERTIEELERRNGEVQRELAGARERIENLEAMLEDVQRNALKQRAENAEAVAEVRDLYERLLALGAAKTERGIRLHLPQDELRFEFGTAELPEGENPSLDRVAALLTDHAELHAQIEGHTDSAGPDSTNQALSEARAEAVREALIERGVAGERLVAEGVGAARPVASNASAEGRRQNRRVEIYLSRGTGSPAEGAPEGA